MMASDKAGAMRERFTAAVPFPHIVLEGLLDCDGLQAINEELDGVNRQNPMSGGWRDKG